MQMFLFVFDVNDYFSVFEYRLLNSCTVILDDYVFAYDVLLMYMHGHCEARRARCSWGDIEFFIIIIIIMIILCYA